MKKTKKTHNVINVAFSNDKDIAFDNNSISINDNTSINSAEKSNKNINDFFPAPQEAMFDLIHIR